MTDPPTDRRTDNATRRGHATSPVTKGRPEPRNRIPDIFKITSEINGYPCLNMNFPLKWLNNLMRLCTATNSSTLKWVVIENWAISLEWDTFIISTESIRMIWTELVEFQTNKSYHSQNRFKYFLSILLSISIFDGRYTE